MSDEIETQEEVVVKRGRKAKPKASEDDLFPIKLKRNYRPAGDFLIERDGDLVDPGINENGYADRDKVMAGTVIHVPTEEARRAVNLGIADRNDDF